MVDFETKMSPPSSSLGLLGGSEEGGGVGRHGVLPAAGIIYPMWAAGVGGWREGPKKKTNDRDGKNF